MHLHHKTAVPKQCLANKVFWNYTKFITKLFIMDFTPSPWTINNNFPKLGSCEQYPRVKFFSSIKGKNLTFGHVTVKWRCLISNYLKKQILLQSTRFLWKNVWRSSIPRGENYMTRVECLKTWNKETRGKKSFFTSWDLFGLTWGSLSLRAVLSWFYEMISSP